MTKPLFILPAVLILLLAVSGCGAKGKAGTTGSAGSWLFSSGKTSAEKALELNEAGMNYYGEGQYDEAIDHHRQALAIDRELGLKADIAIDLVNIGAVYHAWGRYDEAIDHFRQALAIDHKLERKASIATDLNNIGAVYHSRGQYDEAVENFREALDIARKLGDEARVTIFLNNISEVERSKTAGAKPQGAEGMSAKSSEPAVRYFLEAQALQKSGKYLQAAEMFAKSAEAEQASPQPRMKDLAVALNETGFNYKRIGQYDRAIENYRQALVIDRKLRDEAGVATRLNNIGAVYHSWGQYDEAVENFREALAIFRKQGQESSIATLLNNISKAERSKAAGAKPQGAKTVQKGGKP